MNPAKIEWHEWDNETHEGLTPLFPNGKYLIENTWKDWIAVRAYNDTMEDSNGRMYGYVNFTDYTGDEINQDEIAQIALLKED